VHVRIGCSGWNYAHWRNGVFYPPRCPARLWLDYYARSFDTVEINATFYRLPSVKAVEGWVEQSPDGFCFAVKMSRYVTHVKRLRDLAPSMELFYSRIAPLVDSGKLGPVLWQLPGTFRRDDERLAAALGQLPAGRHCVEFRHESWFVPEVYELLRAHDVALVVADRAPRRPSPWVDTTSWAYLRFHHGRARGGDYGRRALETWAERIDSAHRDVFAYFNNDWEGFAVADAKTLKRLVSGG
jgi:uncharacterized protein YecE (DUF72 family)